MTYVSTNLRFPKEEYEEIKRLAFFGNESIASFIRKAAREYKEKKLSSGKSRKAIFDLIVKSAVRIDVPVAKLIQEGRRFE